MSERSGAEDIGRKWYDQKTQWLSARLGPEHESSMHAIIPYALGGALDLWFYPHGIPGTAIATKELSEVPESSPCNLIFSCYELLMFTRAQFEPAHVKKPETPFGKAFRFINGVLNALAPSCATALLNPRESCEFPADIEAVGGTLLLFDGYGSWPKDAEGDFGLLLLLWIHRQEFEFIGKHGSERLLERLKGAGVYPYSDPDRPPVV